MTTTLENPPIIENPLPDLTGHDRCDNGGCNGQAYVLARIGGLDLVFCGHHYASNEYALATQGAEIRDERARLLTSYSDVAATELA